MASIPSYVGYLIVLMFCPYVFATVKHYIEETKDNFAVDVGNTKLRFVSVVFRHGDRTIENDAKLIYPNDPYKNHDDYPNSNGLLTNIGKKRAFRLGERLRKLYGYFLGDVYYPPNVYARSTAIPRTKMTLQLVLAALYPPADSQKWNRKLDWQPVNTIYARVTEDGLLFPYHCKEYEQAYINILKREEVKIRINKFNDLMNDLAEPVGRNVTFYDLFVLYNIFVTYSSMNLTLPDWTRDLFPYGKLHDAALLQYKLYNFNDELIRLNGGKMLYKIIEDLTGIMNGTLADKKINLFSAHDINVVAMLYALNIYDNNFPGYTSSVIIELREKDDKYFVRVLRYLGIPPILIEVAIPGCNSLLCPLKEFIRLTLSKTAEREEPNCPLTISLL